jgi:hypothetical protein
MGGGTAMGGTTGGPNFHAECNAAAWYVEDFLTNPLTRSPPEWSIVAGTWVWVSGADTNYWMTPTDTTHAVAWVGTRSWTDYAVAADLRLHGTSGNAGLIFRIQDPGSGARSGTAANDAGRMYYVGLVPNGQDGSPLGSVVFGYMDDGWHSIQSQLAYIVPDTWYSLVAAFCGSTIKILVNNETAMTLTDSTYAAGSIGIRSYNALADFRYVGVYCPAADGVPWLAGVCT